MSAFETTLNIGSLGVQPLEDENGKSTEAHLVMGVVSYIPTGPGQAVPLPLGLIRVPVDRNALKGFHEEIGRALEVVEERSQVQVASSLDGVDKAAQFQANLRG